MVSTLLVAMVRVPLGPKFPLNQVSWPLMEPPPVREAPASTELEVVTDPLSVIVPPVQRLVPAPLKTESAVAV